MKVVNSRIFKKQLFKSILLFSFLFSFILCNSQEQEPFYEQIAFNYYISEVLPQFPFKKKLIVNPKIQNEKLFWLPKCISDSKNLREKLVSRNINESLNNLNLNDINSKKLKRLRLLRRYNNNFNLKVIFRQEIIEKNMIDVLIMISKKSKFLKYHIVMNKEGKIIKYCFEGDYSYDF